MRWLGISLSVLWAQQSIQDSAIHFFFLSPSYGGYFPQADLARRFGYSSVIGAEASYKFRSGVYITLQGGGLAGDRVHEEGLLEGLYLWSFYESGTVAFIDENGKIFSPTFRQRGWTASVRVGWIVSRLRLPGQNPNCGPFVEVGGGYLMHRIFIDKARSEKLPLLEGEYLKGFDRLTGGWGAVQSIGYRFFSNRGLINFFVAVEAGQYITRSLRGYMYDRGEKDTQRRQDFWVGFRVGWSVPLYEKAPLL